MKNRRARNGLWLLGFALMVGCAGRAGFPLMSQTAAEAAPKQLRERQLIVTLAAEAESHWPLFTRELGADYGLRLVGEFPLSSIRVQCIVFEVPSGKPLDVVLDEVAADPRVESVQINQVFAGLGSVHTDPYAPMQHGAELIRADTAHGVSTGRGVRIAIVDTGVDKGHPDLRGQIMQVANFVENGERSFSQDLHGTAVAGIIAARADNDIGIFGIAPEAQILAEKACWYPPGDTQAVCSSWTLAKAIDFAITTSVQVVNLSLTGPVDRLLGRLIETATGRGIVVVAAVAEPQAPGPGFPASMENVIAVGASDDKGRMPLPQWRANKDILAAPGFEILTTAPQDGYDFSSGSSVATAHVSGVIALLLEKQPRLRPAEIVGLLTAAGSASANEIGVVDACSALAKLMQRPSC